MQYIEPLRRQACLPEEINDSGAIIGYYLTPFVRHTRAFIAHRGMINDPGTFGGKYSRATGINERGLVVGVSTDSTETVRPFLYRGGSLQHLTLPRSRTVYPTAINNRNEIAGYYDTRQSGQPLLHAFIYRDGRVIDLGSLSDYASRATDINNRGQAAGYYQKRHPERSRAFLYDNGRMTDLGDLGGDHSIANSLNDRGEIVGYSALSGDKERRDFRAFLYRHGRMIDLNTRIPRDSGWVLLVANGINNRGQIVGYGRRNGQRRAFLLTPSHR
jgi:probable HAF family extracellular repeat protein